MAGRTNSWSSWGSGKPGLGSEDRFQKEQQMVTRTSEAEWRGPLAAGVGSVKLGSGAFEGRYSFKSRFEDGPGTNPEELLGAAHAACFSMALSLVLGDAGFSPRRIATSAAVEIERSGDGFAIPRIRLTTRADVPGIDQAAFAGHAETAKRGCPVSKALAGVEIVLDAQLADPG
jgi:lipoyl-dependent peroxiredoxin